MDYMYPELNTRFIFFKKNDPLRELLSINKKQTLRTNLLKYDKPLETGYERDETSVYLYRKKDSSTFYDRPWRGVSLTCVFQKAPSRKERGEFLDKIFPPKEWLYDGFYWTQHVSTTPSDRNEALKLDGDFTHRLRKAGARPIFLCGIRRTLYRQCFDEIIRQELLLSQKRGLLLLKCRDEIYSDLAKMEKVCHSQWAHGLRKSMQLSTKRSTILKGSEETKLVLHTWEAKKEMMVHRLATMKADKVRKKRPSDTAQEYLLAKLKAENTLLKQQVVNVTTTADVSGFRGIRKNERPPKKTKKAGASLKDAESDGSSLVSTTTGLVAVSRESKEGI